ncbi:MAG: histidine phosphatase family protein [Fretibacterium sp.]|nr:histidine phosphatase family protein [Fretibacterium sp.]
MSKGFRRRRIVLVRHGMTDWNRDYRFQGRTDVPLNDEGRAQAARLAARLASWPMEVVYSSPLQRALGTAQALAEPHDRTPVTLDGLAEVNFGAWEGCSVLGLKKTRPDAFGMWMRDPFFNMPPGAEDWTSIRGRVASAVERILEGPQERIAIVSHGGIVRVLYAVLVGLDPHTVWRLRVHNCSVSGVEIREDGASLVFSNDDLHLRGDTEGSSLPLW